MLQNKVVIADGANPPALREEPSGPAGGTNKECEVGAVYRQIKIQKLQLKNNEDVKKKDEEWIEQDQSYEVKMAQKYVESKDEYTDMLSAFAGM